jgi:hypothetical protein
LDVPFGSDGDKPMKPHIGPAKVIPFPIVRRVAYAAASYRNPDKYLASVYRQQEAFHFTDRRRK